MTNVEIFYVIMFGLVFGIIALLMTEIKQLRRTVSLHDDILMKMQNFLIDIGSED